MNTTKTTVTRKATATATAVPTKTVSRKASPKTVAPKTVAPTVSVPTVSLEQFETLVNTSLAMAKQIDALTVRCDTLERLFSNAIEVIIESARVPSTIAPTAPKAVAPTVSVPTDNPNGFIRLLDDAVEDVISGIESNRYNVNVTIACPHDLRRYASRATNKALKAYRDANGLTLPYVAQALVDAFDAVSAQPASTFEPNVPNAK